MTTIKAIVRNGRIEVDQPLNLPDGTELRIPVPNQKPVNSLRDDDTPEAPEAIEQWIRWFDALEPIEFTEQERVAWEAARREERDVELAQWAQRGQRVEGLFP